MVTLFLGMLLAHLLYDCHIQDGTFIAKRKGDKLFALIVHAGTNALASSTAVWVILGHICPWWVPVCIFVSHMMVDRWKSRTPKDEAHFYYIYIDQGLHYAVLLLISYLLQ